MSAAAVPAGRRSRDHSRRTLRVIDAARPTWGLTPRAGSARRVPELRDGLVRRPRLVRRLTEAAGVPLVIVAAPAGYGKTTLLSEWARQDERQFAWVTLDDADNDPALLMAEIADALGARHP